MERLEGKNATDAALLQRDPDVVPKAAQAFDIPWGMPFGIGRKSLTGSARKSLSFIDNCYAAGK